jgi:hypothetical protein
MVAVPQPTEFRKSMARPVRELAKILYFVAFLAAGLLLVRSGALPVWMFAIAVVVVAGMRVLSRLDAYQDDLAVSDEGITRIHGSRMRKMTEEKVRWDELERVELLTREVGPDKRDMLFVLYGAGTSGVAVAGPVADRHGLPSALAAKLPGFREDLVQDARAATQQASFLLWERRGS